MNSQERGVFEALVGIYAIVMGFLTVIMMLLFIDPAARHSQSYIATVVFVLIVDVAIGAWLALIWYAYEGGK